MIKKIDRYLRWRKELILPCFILLISLFMLNFMDVISTSLFLARGIKEANPLFQGLNNGMEGVFWPLMIKLFFLPLLCAAMLYPNILNFRMLYVVDVIYISVILNNLLALII